MCRSDWQNFLDKVHRNYLSLKKQKHNCKIIAASLRKWSQVWKTSEHFGSFPFQQKKISAYYREIVYLHGYDKPLKDKHQIKVSEQQLQVKAIMLEQYITCLMSKSKVRGITNLSILFLQPLDFVELSDINM
jgi:hypothetical protein